MIRYVILAAAFGGAAATFLPWEHYGTQAVDGWQASGMISFVAFCIAFVAGVTKPHWYVRLAIVITGVVAISVAAGAIGRVGAIHKELAMSLDPTARREAVLYRVGTGAWLVIASSVMLILSGLVWKLPRPGARAPVELPRAKLVR
jgi:hypothetical protein